MYLGYTLNVLPVDPHQVLGVPPDATVRQIRKAYKRLARRHHPDHNPEEGATARFIALKAAHDELLRRLEAGETGRDAAPLPPATPPPQHPRPPEPVWEEDVQIGLRDLWRPALYMGSAIVWFLFLWISLSGIKQAAQALGPRPLPPAAAPVAPGPPIGHP
jgi:hypothetical protein